MSMKRTKKSSGGGRGPSEGSLGFNPPTTALPEWAAVVESQPAEAFAPYVPANTYARDALLEHAKFGRGKVIAVDGGRIEVLFSDGMKKLAHGIS